MKDVERGKSLKEARGKIQKWGVECDLRISLAFQTIKAEFLLIELERKKYELVQVGDELDLERRQDEEKTASSREKIASLDAELNIVREEARLAGLEAYTEEENLMSHLRNLKAEKQELQRVLEKNGLPITGSSGTPEGPKGARRWK